MQLASWAGMVQHPTPTAFCVDASYIHTYIIYVYAEGPCGLMTCTRAMKQHSKEHFAVSHGDREAKGHKQTTTS